MKCAVIFGGTGFIGSFFAAHILDENIVDTVYLVDHEALESKTNHYRRTSLNARESVHNISADVRHKIEWVPSENVVLVANFAAVHREPGHNSNEYYETNILGAENVCNWCDLVGCKSLIFTSSISPYGPGLNVKSEKTLPVPATPYGNSKLIAEKIHYSWFSADKTEKKLIIVRPGVVFGPGEGGNVSRLIKSVLGGYFVYVGNRKTRKAGVYVKELCSALTWAMDIGNEPDKSYIIFNMTMNPGPSIENYVESICRVAKISQRKLSIPFLFIYSASIALSFVLGILRISHPFSPTRVKKLVSSNDIRPDFLIENGYNYKFNLDSALNDWKETSPEEWI